MRKFSWIFLGLLALCVILAVPTRAQAAQIVDSGSCGPAATWTLDSDGVLTISGTGAIDSYKNDISDITQDITRNIDPRPWESKLDQITTLVIQEGITKIGAAAFAFCENLVRVTIPNSVTVSEIWAFTDCGSPMEVYIDDIGAWASLDAFSWAGRPSIKQLYLKGQPVTDLVIPEGVKQIRDYAFSNCSSIKSVTIPESVTEIGDGAFDSCKSLVSVKVPKSIVIFSLFAFSGCERLTDIYIEDMAAWAAGEYPGLLSANSLDKKLYLKGQLVTDLVIPEGVTQISSGAFSNCGSITSVTIPEGVTQIGSGAFSNCGSITNVVIPEGVTQISSGAFSNCGSITSVVIPEGVTGIEWGVFSNCKALKSITIPGSVTNIDDGAFSGCESLTDIYIEDMAAWTAGECPELLSVNSLDKKLYLKGQLVTDLVIPAGVTKLREGLFANCGSIKSVTIPEGVTEVGPNAFANCKSLISVKVPKSIVIFSYFAFSGCESLTDVYITDLTAWLNMSYVTGDGKSNPLSANELDKNLYLNGQKLTNVTIPEDVKWITGSAFYKCSSLTGVTIPEGVRSIEERAFYGCTNLRSITIPTSVYHIGGEAFSGCYSLWHVLYKGTQTQWDEVGFSDGNSYLIDATRHYNCTGKEMKPYPKETCTIKVLEECSVCNDMLWEAKPGGKHNFVNNQCTKCGERDGDVKPEEELVRKGLSALTVEGFSLMPVFDPKITRYEVFLPYEVESVRIQATAADSKATVTVEGGDALVAGESNEILVICVGENGSRMIYTVVAQRAAENGEYPQNPTPSQPGEEQPSEPVGEQPSEPVASESESQTQPSTEEAAPA